MLRGKCAEAAVGGSVVRQVSSEMSVKLANVQKLSLNFLYTLLLCFASSWRCLVIVVTLAAC